MATTVQRCTVGHSAVVDDTQTLVWVVCLIVPFHNNFSRLSSSPMSVVPGMNASSAQVLRTIAMAVANSLLCDIGDCQVPCDKESSVRCVNPYNFVGGARFLAWSPFSICAYRDWLIPEAEEGKFEMLAGTWRGKPG